jgi:hypothetical protein
MATLCPSDAPAAPCPSPRVCASLVQAQVAEAVGGGGYPRPRVDGGRVQILHQVGGRQTIPFLFSLLFFQVLKSKFKMNA